MRSLSSSDGSKSRFTIFLHSHVNKVCVLVYIIGLLYFGVILWPAFNNRTYFSENALLPGLVDEEFSSNQKISTFAKELNQFLGKSDEYKPATEWLYRQFSGIGLESYVQNFTLSLPIALSEPINGSNVYGILRAPRGSASEAIVVCLPYRMNSVGSISLVLAVASFCREQIYWAKDIIFVIGEHEEIGIQAWLSAYHDAPIDSLKSAPLAAHAGSIQAGICLEVKDGAKSFNHANIKFNMINGQLPNLDLVNLAVKMVQKEGMEATLFYKEDYWDIYSYKGYMRSLRTSLRQLFAQAAGRPNGLHSLFGQYGIEAITIQPYSRGKKHRSETGFLEVGRVIESMLRSVNNLLERFHQSFFFYFLPTTHRYVSIGLFMPAVGLMLLAPLLKAWFLWIEVSEKATASCNGDVKDNPNMTDFTLLSVLPYMAMSHLSGLAIYYLPTFLSIMLPPNTEQFFAGTSGCIIAFGTFPWLLTRNMARQETTKKPSFDLLRCLILIELALVVGVQSVFNFGLGFFLSVFWIPVCMLAVPSENRISWFIRTLFLALINPLVCVFLGNFTYAIVASKAAFLPSLVLLLDAAYQMTKSAVLSVVIDSLLYGSNMLSLISLCLFPVWIVFWTLVNT